MSAKNILFAIASVALFLLAIVVWLTQKGGGEENRFSEEDATLLQSQERIEKVWERVHQKDTSVAPVYEGPVDVACLEELLRELERLLASAEIDPAVSFPVEEAPAAPSQTESQARTGLAREHAEMREDISRQTAERDSLEKQERELLEKIKRFEEISELLKASPDEISSEFRWCTSPRRVKRKIENLDQGIEKEKKRLENKIAPIELRVPDPRPVDRNMRVCAFICRNRRIFPLDMVLIDSKLQEAIACSRDGTGKVNGWLLSDYFKRNKVSDRYVEVTITRDFYLYITPRSVEQGETLEELKEEDSIYRRTLAKFSPEQNYTVFAVWEDAFAAYLEARKIAESAGFRAGWIPISAHQTELREDLLSPGGSGIVD